MSSEVDIMDLAELMAVQPGDVTDTYIGAPEAYGMLGIYGGHFVGQALAAGFETVAEDKLAQSLHAYFLRKGDPDQPIVYEVQRLKQGRGIEVRSIVARQSGEIVFSMMASYKRLEEGDEHQPTAPDVVSPAALRRELEQRPKRFNPPMMAGGRAELLLISDSFVPEQFEAGRAPELRVWMRSTQARALSVRENQCVLGFLSDGTLMFNSVLPHGIPFQTHLLTTLDHSVWFHRSTDVREWMLFDQCSTAAADGRGMNEGKAYDLSGRLLYSASQESMLRRIPSS